MSLKPELFRFTEADRIAVLKHYNRTPENVKIDIQTMKTWLNSQPHLPQDIFSERRIETFLILNKFSIEKTKGKMDMYCTIRKHIPDIYQDKDPSQKCMKDFCETVYWLPLPGLTKDLYRPIVFCVVVPDASKFDPYCLFAHTFNVAEVRLDHDLGMGEISIWDLKNVTMAHLTKITPVSLKKASTILEKVFSARAKGFHFINCPSAIDTFFSLVKSVVKPKLANRIHVHKDIKSLYKYVPQELLPEEYGGKEGSVHKLQENWNKALEDYGPWFEKLKSITVDESLRPGKPLNSDFLGFYGNFRKLDLD